MANSLDNLIVIIPSFEPTPEFIDYAKEVEKIAKAIIVVNDGSDESYDYIFNEISKLVKVIYLPYRKNRGKGYALKLAFKYCAERFPKTDFVITADCDGQHKLYDITNVYNALQLNPESYMLGVRDVNHPYMPKTSKQGNAVTRFMFKLFYSIQVSDSQTGLRGQSNKYSLFFARIPGNRFDYEHATLIHCKRRNVPICETPIETVYPEHVEDHVSHYRKFRDSVRVMFVMLSNLLLFFSSSILSAGLDLGAYYLLSKYAFSPITPALRILLSTVIARIFSSIFNFFFNFKIVFHNHRRSALPKYYVVWIVQLCASYALVYLFAKTSNEGIQTIVKLICDLCLALISFKVQQAWVFKVKKNSNPDIETK